MSDEIYSPQWKGQRAGAHGLESLGMPTIWGQEFWRADPYLYSAMWTYEDQYGERSRTYAALHGELIVLEAMGLIEIISTERPLYDKLAFKVDFKYTDAGALIVYEAME